MQNGTLTCPRFSRFLSIYQAVQGDEWLTRLFFWLILQIVLVYLRFWLFSNWLLFDLIISLVDLKVSKESPQQILDCA